MSDDAHDDSARLDGALIDRIVTVAAISSKGRTAIDTYWPDNPRPTPPWTPAQRIDIERAIRYGEHVMSTDHGHCVGITDSDD